MADRMRISVHLSYSIRSISGLSKTHITSFYKPVPNRGVLKVLFLVIHRHFCGKCRILITPVEKKKDFIIEDKQFGKQHRGVYIVKYLGLNSLFLCLFLCWEHRLWGNQMEAGKSRMFIHFTLKSITKTDSFSSHTATRAAFLVEVWFD